MYEAFVAEYYDYLPVTAGRPDVAFYLEAAQAFGGPILELGCGTGRVLLPIARAGHRITGLDQSKAMLGRARAKLSQEPREVQERTRLVEGDMTDFDLGEPFRLVIIPFRPFQHLLTVEAQLACLGHVKRHLAPGGRLIMDFFQADLGRICDPKFLEESGGLPEVTLPDGRKVLLTNRTVAFHRAEQQNDVEMYFNVTHPEGRAERFTHAFTVRYFFRFEVEHLLERCGLRVMDVFGSFDRTPLADESADMIFVAEKT